jgi:hypothetical protein
MSTVEIPPGTSVCGCVACEEIFTSLTAFDRHQTLRPEEKGGGVICHDPATRGLVQYERVVKEETWVLWGSPGPAEGTPSRWA